MSIYHISYLAEGERIFVDAAVPYQSDEWARLTRQQGGKMDMYDKTRLIMPIVLLASEEAEPRSQAGLRVSMETYWQKYVNDLDFIYEWNDGYLEEKPRSKKETKNGFHWLLKALEIYLEAYPIAEIYGLETAFVLRLPQKTTIRRPYLGIVKKDNPLPFKAKTDNYDGIFDLCIEALSDSNKSNVKQETIHKKDEYEERGIPEYYILDDLGFGNKTHFYTMNQWGLYEEIKPIDGDIIVSQVLPGFQFRISDLYRQPPLSELVKDEVYQGYVMLKYQAEKERAEKAEQRAEQAEKRAQQAEKEIQRLMALLRKQGVSPAA